MADSYFLRPSADKGTLGHTCSTGSSGYSLINEETHDGDNGYIYHKCSYTSSSKSSTFLFTSKNSILINTTLPAGLMYGDIDQDGVITQNDVDTIKQHILAGGIITDATALALADTNGDGSVSAKDYSLVDNVFDLSGTISSYAGDYNGSWSVNTSKANGDGGIFYYDITTSNSTTSCMAILSPSFAVNKNEFYCQCFDGYVRVFARNLPKYSINVTIEIFQSSEAISATLPAGLMYGDVNGNGILDEEDYSLILKYASGDSSVLSDEQLALADANGDGVVNAKDSQVVAQLEGQTMRVTVYKGDSLGNWSLSTNWGADFSRRFYYDITTSASTTSTMAFVIPNGNIRSYSGFQCECFNGYIRVYAKNLPLNEISINIRVINVDKTISSTLPAGQMYGDFDDDGVLTEEDADMLRKYIADNSVFDTGQVEIADINSDSSINGKDRTALRKIINLLAPDSTYNGDYLGNWSVNNARTDGDPKVFYYDISNNQITTDYNVYIYTNSDTSTNDYIAECFSGYVRVYARNIPKAQTTIKIGLKQKKSYPLGAVSGVNLHLVARGSSSVTSPSIKCLFAVGSENGGTNAEMSIESSTLTTSYADYSASSAAMATAINNYITANNAFPTISATLTTSGTSYAQAQIRITQIYVELLYDDASGGGATTTALRIKQNGAWTPVTKVYKKVNNSWVEQTDLNSLFNSNTKYIKK